MSKLKKTGKTNKKLCKLKGWRYHLCFWAYLGTVISVFAAMGIFTIGLQESVFTAFKMLPLSLFGYVIAVYADFLNWLKGL